MAIFVDNAIVCILDAEFLMHHIDIYDDDSALGYITGYLNNYAESLSHNVWQGNYLFKINKRSDELLINDWKQVAYFYEF